MRDALKFRGLSSVLEDHNKSIISYLSITTTKSATTKLITEPFLINEQYTEHFHTQKTELNNLGSGRDLKNHLA